MKPGRPPLAPSTRRLVVLVPSTVKAALERTAREAGRPVASIVREAIEAHLPPGSTDEDPDPRQEAITW